MLGLIKHPNDLLARFATPVSEDSLSELATFVSELTELMKLHGGIGIAAPQVGCMQRIIVVTDNNDNTICMINPKYTFVDPSTSIDIEGCLSLPGVEVPVARSNSVVVEYNDVEGIVHSMMLSSRAARIVQHEIDHLDGLTLFDRVDRRTRKALKKKKGMNK